MGYAQQGPSVRIDGELPSNAVPVSVGDHALVNSGVTISNGTMGISGSLVLYGVSNVTQKSMTLYPDFTNNVLRFTIIP